MVRIVLIGRAIKVFLAAVIATFLSDQIAAQTSQLADVPESCTSTDPLFAHRLSARKELLHRNLVRNRALLDELEDQYPEGHPDVVAAKRDWDALSQQLDAADAVARSDCIEQVSVQGEWVPAGLSLEDWREIVGETQRTAYRVFDVLESRFGPIPNEGCPGMQPSGLENYSEDWEFPVDLPPCSFYMFVIKWDERRGLFFIRKNDEWIRFVPNGFE